LLKGNSLERGAGRRVIQLERELRRFRLKARMEREQDLVINALRLREASPEETLETMFDLVEFARELRGD